MVWENQFRQDHLPPLKEDEDGSEKYTILFPGRTLRLDPTTGFFIIDAEEVGVLSHARLAHRALSHDAGSVKFPAKAKLTSKGELEDAATGMLMPIFDRVEDSIILGFVDVRGNNLLLKEIADYAKKNPTHEFPWLEVHPAGQRVFQDGHGSYVITTKAGHRIELKDEKEKEALEIESAKDAPLTVRAKGEGKLTLESETGEIEIITKDATIGIKDGKVTVKGDGISLLASDVKAGVEADVKKLVTDAIKQVFDSHVHTGVQGGGSSSGPPSTPLPESVFTKNLKGS